MLKGLQKKWGVTPLSLVLILCTFAIGGSLSGYGPKTILPLLNIEKGFLYWVLYFVIVTLLWPLCVILVSIPLGQYKFFSGYLKKMGKRFGIVKGDS